MDIEQDHYARVLRETLKRLVLHLEMYTPISTLPQDAIDDYQYARMLVGRTDGDWDSYAAERATPSIRRAALGSESECCGELVELPCPPEGRWRCLRCGSIHLRHNKPV